jgi:predicted dehydrogenase
VNWRMYERYSRGLIAELGSHQTSLAEWYLGADAQSVYGTGGIFCYKDGREVDDHIHATFEFPKGCTAELSVILSNRYGGLGEEFLGEKGSLVLSDLDGAMLFTNDPIPTGPREGRDETLPWSPDWGIAYRTEIWTFCAAIRQGVPLLCGPERALVSTTAALAAHAALRTQTRVAI